MHTNHNNKMKNSRWAIIITYSILSVIVSSAFGVVLLLGILSGGLAINPSVLFDFLLPLAYGVLVVQIVLSTILWISNLSAILRPQYKKSSVYRYRIASLFSILYLSIGEIVMIAIGTGIGFNEDSGPILFPVPLLLSHVVHLYMLNKEHFTFSSEGLESEKLT